MKAFISTATVLLALSAGAAQAQQVKPLFERGSWIVTTGLSNKNNPICSLGLRSIDRQLYIKNVAGQKGLVVHIFKDGWKLPNNVDVPLSFTFDQYPALPTTGHGWNSETVRNLSFVEFFVAPEFTIEFLTRFSKGSKQTVTFESGNEPAWEANLIGSNDAVQVLAGCMSSLTPTTQPYSPKSTQPYNESKRQPPVKPTQPFGGKPSAVAKDEI